MSCGLTNSQTIKVLFGRFVDAVRPSKPEFKVPECSERGLASWFAAKPLPGYDNITVDRLIASSEGHRDRARMRDWVTCCAPAPAITVLPKASAW